MSITEIQNPATPDNTGSSGNSQSVEPIEAPLTWRTYILCGFAAFGGIFFGAIEGADATELSDSHSSLIISILSVGTFIGAIIAGDVADAIGRRWAIISGCIIYTIDVVIQMLTGTASALAPIVAGRLIAGFGVGFVSAIVVLYMSETCPRRVRGAMVSAYQWCITIGLMMASFVVYATEGRSDMGSFLIPISIRFPCSIILGSGLFFLPDSPRCFVKKGNIAAAKSSLARFRGQSEDSVFVKSELAEIVANERYESALTPSTTWAGSWANFFNGSLWDPSSNMRRSLVGMVLHMMQQWSGVNFIFYYSTPFLKSTGAISNSFLISLIFTLVNVISTPVSFWTVEKFGRRTILLAGEFGMMTCQLLVASIGITIGFDHTHPDPSDPSSFIADNVMAVNAQIAFIAFFIFWFASTWGPASWVVVGEIFPLPIRARGVALATARNWLWNAIIALATPYMVHEDRANMKSSVFFVWGTLWAAAFVFTYFFLPETKGLSVDKSTR